MENSTERIEDLISGRLTEVEASELNAQIAEDSSLKPVKTKEMKKMWNLLKMKGIK